MNNEENIVEILKGVEEEYNKKRKKYGNTDAKIAQMVAAVYPDGIPVEKYDEFTFMMKFFEKISRLTNEGVDSSSKIDALADIAGYALLGLMKESKKTPVPSDPIERLNRLA